MSFLFQKENLLTEFNILENMLLPLIIKGETYKSSLKRVKYLLESINMEKYLYRYPNELSEGEKQRISLLRCFVNKPKIIIADEPTASLDENNCKQLLELLVKLNKEIGITYIIATHDHRFNNISNNVYNLFNGGIIKDE